MASAQGLVHVYGPRGSGTERRAIVVVERAGAGACVPAEQVQLAAADPDTRMTLEEPAGPCARWVRIQTKLPRAAVQIRSRAGSHPVAVLMGDDGALRLMARIRGGRLHVRVEGAGDGAAILATAFWPGGSRRLEPSGNGELAGPVPPSGLVGVLARSETMLGVTALTSLAGRSGHAEAVVMPARGAVPAGGAPRTAAFVAVTDTRERLSDHVPLQITSSRGRLHGLRWIRPGIAAIELGAPAGIETVDLQVRVGSAGAHVASEIPVVAGWPVAASVEPLSSPVAGEPLRLRVAVRDVEGHALPATRVRVRCGKDMARVASAQEEAEAPIVECAPSAAGPLDVIALALVDGQSVPLTGRTLAVRPTPPPVTPRSPPPPRPAAPRAPPVPKSSWALGAYGHVGVDTWSRGTYGAGVRAEVGPWRWLRLGATVRYGATPYRAHSVDPRLGASLSGTTHTVEALFESSALLPLRSETLVARLGIGPGFERDAGKLGQTATSGDRWELGGQIAFGSKWTFGKWQVDLEVGGWVRLVEVQSGAPWPQARGRFFVEAGGAFAP